MTDMDTSTERHADNSDQEQQREMVEQARSLAGVADVIDLYNHLAPYTGVMSYVQQTQVRNATGGNL